MSADDLPGLPVVAAFDVDGTVTTRDCVVPFLRMFAGTVPVGARLLGSAPQVVPALLRRDRDRLKASLAKAAFAGRRFDDVSAAGEEFAGTVERRWLRNDAVARMGWHRDCGHEVVLVSASFAVYLRPLAQRLGVVSGVLATELAVEPDGRCTGGLLGPNCRGPEKVHRLHAWLDECHDGRGAVEVWAYGNSPGDRELLADADHAVWVRSELAAEPLL